MALGLDNARRLIMTRDWYWLYALSFPHDFLP